MIDTYIWGNIHRNSPEAQVPIVSVDAMEHRLGGAANVALNLKYLGAEVDLMTITGNDGLHTVMAEQLEYEQMRADYLIIIQDRKTTSKTRIYNGDQYVLRCDDEITEDIYKEDQIILMQLFEQYIQEQKPDLVLFQDYNKGMLTEWVITKAISICKQAGVLTAVDPKKKNFFAYKQVDLFKPNLKEVSEALSRNIQSEQDIQQAAQSLKEQLQADMVMITLSEKGAMLLGEHYHHTAAIKRNIVDVSGAGDTVIAVASLCLANQMREREILHYSNLAGGMVCEKAGVVCITAQQLLKEIQTHPIA